ncbi:MAG: T9SS type A sorting domain-containing protein [Bacteroidetes bacterium]|nr:T9SS type A sorting domain-containing protein [Bacteroidota bacterium]MBS1628800.1 T9SS type A sorting domain-containing protein [Bacteroidota bacterium]
MKRTFLMALLLLNSSCLFAQYAPQVGLSGSSALSKSSPLFVGWANACAVQRGLQQAGNPGLGLASMGNNSLALGPANGTVVSLGDSGVALLQFASPISDGPGADFAVFENGFFQAGDSVNAFLELAFVEVSSDGNHFVRFPASSLTQDTLQLSPSGSPSLIDARQIDNLAGKYIAGWGTPFDLAELADSPGLDIHAITHVRLVDVVGSIGMYASHDHAGHIINDPFPSPFPSSGFDLDAVGVIHQLPLLVPEPIRRDAIRCLPQPAGAFVQLQWPFASAHLQVFDASGRQLKELSVTSNMTRLSLEGMTSGVYFITATSNDGRTCRARLLHY